MQRKTPPKKRAWNFLNISLNITKGTQTEKKRRNFPNRFSNNTVINVTINSMHICRKKNETFDGKERQYIQQNNKNEVKTTIYV